MSDQVLGIISDSGYVLYDDTPGKRANHEAVRRLHEIDYDEFTRRIGPYRRRAQRDPAYSDEDALADLARELGIDADQVLETRRELHTTRVLRAGVRETLAELKRLGVPFVILSDTHRTADQLKKRYETVLGLIDMVTGFITSKDMELRKPDPGMYQAAYRRVVEELRGPSPDLSQVAFLGHDLDELEGAHQCGLRPLAIFFRGHREQIAFIPDQDILPDFSRLTGFVGKSHP